MKEGERVEIRDIKRELEKQKQAKRVKEWEREGVKPISEVTEQVEHPLIITERERERTSKR